MHSICLGVIKMFILLWISGTKVNKTKPWFIGDKIEVINSRLSNVLPPIEIKRTPSKDYLDKIPFWKAHEFKAFGIYYYPVLDGILPEPYFSHFATFSHGIYTLLLEQVDADTVRGIGLVLDHFVAETESLYGRIHCTYNLHLVTHLSQSVLDWGCLWASSAFIPEWFNGDLQSMVHGTQAAVEQMSSTYLMRTCIRNEAIEMLSDPSVHLPPKTVSLLQNLLHLPSILFPALGAHRTIHRKVMPNDVVLLGKPSFRILRDVEVAAIRELLALDSTQIKLNPVSLRAALSSVASVYSKLE